MVALCVLTMRRTVLPRGKMRIRPTMRGRQPNRLNAMVGARRTLTSSIRLVSSSDPIVLFTSQTATARKPAWAAKRSIDPRSPNSENDTSAKGSHARVRNTAILPSASAACRSSSRRSAAAPFHHGTSRARPSTASNSDLIRSRRTSPALPASRRFTSRSGTRAAAAKSTWVCPARLRIRRSSRPSRSSSVFVSPRWRLALTNPLVAAYRSTSSACALFRRSSNSAQNVSSMSGMSDTRTAPSAK